MSDVPQRRWFRFSLRTLFVLVTVLCCWLAWESSVVRARKNLLRELKVNPTYTVTTAAEWARRYPTGFLGQPPKAVPFVRRCLGDEAIQEIGYYTYRKEKSQLNLPRIARTFPEAELKEDHPPLEPCHPGCFPRGTFVETPGGPRAIETIRAGEELIAILPSGEMTIATVQSVFVTTNRLWRIETAAGVFFTTKQQPLCLAADRTLPAGELEPGQSILRFERGATCEANVVSAAPTDRIETVFNLVLGDCERFIAGGYLARSKPPALAASAED